MKRGAHAAENSYGLRNTLERWRWPRPVLALLAIPLGFFLLEFPCNDLLFNMGFELVILNIWILALLFAIIYTLGMRSRASIIVFLAACLIAGIANHYVLLFKDQPIMPADLFALGTAAAVSGNYQYPISANMIIAIVVFVAYSVLVFLLPKRKLKMPLVVGNLACCALLVVTFGWWMENIDLGHEHAIGVDAWFASDSYRAQGSTVSFLKRVQELEVDEPEGYSTARVDELLSEYGDPFDPSSADLSEAPTVIAVMNESFGDLARYPYLEQGVVALRDFHRVASSSLEYGTAFVSAFGGSTCNSEFEFLTGSSLGYMGTGVYPYMLYDLNDAESLVSYFNALGYPTTAIHPEMGSNWRRDIVYSQLGFDTFLDKASFEGADTLRDHVTDKATYELILDLLKENDQPQFIFDVTMQNHGGYSLGTIPKDMQVHVDLLAGDVAEEDARELDEYSSSLLQSEKDLMYFVEELNKVDEPLLLCFFGDHQAYFAEWLYAVTHFKLVQEVGIDAVQETYSTPYIIWANKAYYESRGSDFDPAAIFAPEAAGQAVQAGDNGQSVAPEQSGQEQWTEGDNPWTDETAQEEQVAAEADWAEEGAGLGEGEGAIPEEGSSEGYSGVEGPETMVVEADTSNGAGQDLGPIVAHAEGALALFGEEPAPGNLVNGSNNVSWGTTSSLNYLAAKLASYTGLPLTNFQQYQLDGLNIIPAQNMNAYLSPLGIWHYYDGASTGSTTQHLNDAAILQYDNLFNKSKDKSAYWVTPGYQAPAN